MTDIIIIGAGTAGMTAALYALRAGKSVLLLENETIGGQIASSPKVENFPSVVSISGYELSDRMFDQVTSHGADFDPVKAESIVKVGECDFRVKAGKSEYSAKSVIIAAGVKHKKLRYEGEDTLKGISFCAVCDGAFYKGKDVILLGDGNTALQYGILLSNYCNKVYVCTLFDKFFGDNALVKTLLARKNVEWRSGISCKAYLTEDGVNFSGAAFGKFPGGEPAFDLKSDACFVAIGQVPDNKAFENVAELDKFGFIVTDGDCACSTEGVYAAGDCRVKKVRQLTTAAADGAVAAIAACAYIDRNSEN